MGRSLTVLLKTIESTPHSAGFEFNTNDETWLIAGPAAGIFTTKKGKYAYIGVGAARLCVLQKMDGHTRVGDLRGGFDAESGTAGQNGTGHSDESGTAFNWTIDKAVPI
jgi:hypothetical protein